MNARKTPNDILREKYMSTKLKKTAKEATFPLLKDLGGVKDIIPQLNAHIYRPLFEREKYVSIGGQPPKSVLIYGSSGVGKTYSIQCFCKEHEIPLITSLIETTKDIKDLFMKSKSTEKSVILIKNVESLFETPSLKYQLEACIEEMNWSCVIVMTNKDIPDDLRFDAEIFVKIPTYESRKEILECLIKNLAATEINTDEIVRNTPGFVAADIVKLVGMAVSSALCRGSTLVDITDFQAAITNWRFSGNNITFDDIGALDNVKEELKMSILLPSRYPARFLSFGISRPSGILLYGPPGCGKTLIAKAVSNMSHCNFLYIRGPELITKYVGDSEKHLRDLFQKAKNLSPCVLFFDEIDSLCSKRGKNEFGSRIVNQILTLLDGMDDRGEVYIIGATNRINSIDSALMRPGRFDKLIEVPLPTPQEAASIFQKCLRSIPHNKDIMVDESQLEGLSGADISGIIKEAALLCLKENFDNEDLRVSQEYIEKALQKVRRMKEGISNFADQD